MYIITIGSKDELFSISGHLDIGSEHQDRSAEANILKRIILNSGKALADSTCWVMPVSVYTVQSPPVLQKKIAGKPCALHIRALEQSA